MSNESMKGYVIKALKSLGINNSTINDVLDELDYLIDVKTQTEAEQVYEKWIREVKE